MTGKEKEEKKRKKKRKKRKKREKKEGQVLKERIGAGKELGKELGKNWGRVYTFDKAVAIRLTEMQLQASLQLITVMMQIAD